MASEPITEQAPERPSREYRATVAFLATGMFMLILVLLYRGTISSVPPIGAMMLAGPAIGVVVDLAIAFGLGWGFRWAHAAMTPALWTLGFSGLVTFLASLVGGGLDVPIGPILAIWALRAPPRGTPDVPRFQPAGRGVAAVVVIALVVVAGWPLAVRATTQPGGPLLAAADDLHLDLAAAAPCVVGPGSAHEPPEAIEVVLRWTWARDEPIRAGTDAVVLSWATMGGPDGSGGFYLDQPIPQQPGITEEDRSGTFAVYRNDLAERGFEPGLVTIRLRRPHELGSGPGLVQVAARYAHHYVGLFGTTPGGVWTSAETMTCEW